jgi:RNA-directed DNA polymerase
MEISLKSLFDDFFLGSQNFDDFIGHPVNDCKPFVEDEISSIVVAGDTLRSYHNFLTTHVISYLPVCAEAVYSYRNGVTIATAVRQHVSSKYFYQTDLNNFFGSVDEDFLFTLLAKNSAHFPFIFDPAYVKQIVRLLTHQNRLAVGYSTSPKVSNACLYEFDLKVLSYCKERRLIYSRYSDDIIISGLESAPVKAAAAEIQVILAVLYGSTFLVNSAKSKFTRVGRKIKLLGLVILPNKVVSIDMHFKRYVEKRIHYYLTDSLKFLKLMGADEKKGISKMCGYLSYVNSVDPAYLKKLRRKYGDIIDMFLHRSFVK